MAFIIAGCNIPNEGKFSLSADLTLARSQVVPELPSSNNSSPIGKTCHKTFVIIIKIVLFPDLVNDINASTNKNI